MGRTDTKQNNEKIIDNLKVINRALILTASVAVMFSFIAGYAGLGDMPEDAVYKAGGAASGLIFMRSALALDKVSVLIKSFGAPSTGYK